MASCGARERTPGFERTTATRRALVAAADALTRAFTVEDLLERASEQGSRVSTATAYRTVAAMEQCGQLERVGIRAGATLYARCGRASEHHHHVICDECGLVAPTECTLSAEVARVAAESGYVITGHELVLHGLCPACSSRRSA